MRLAFLSSSSPRRALLIACLLATLALAGAVAIGLLTNPTVYAGQSATFSKTGTHSPSAQDWDIVNPSGTVIATQSTPNGWTVSYSQLSFTVGAPTTAATGSS